MWAISPHLDYDAQMWGFVTDMVEMKNKIDKYMIKVNDDPKKEWMKMILSMLV